MSEHTAKILWDREPHPDDRRTYCRNHASHLNGNQVVWVSASADYKGDPMCADPEQLVVSAVGSCHMLFFLAIAEHQGFQVETYRDQPIGYLGKSDRGRMELIRIVLSPSVTFSGDKQPDAAAIDRIHAGAHKNCFIGNSLRAEVRIQPAA